MPYINIIVITFQSHRKFEIFSFAQYDDIFISKGQYCAISLIFTPTNKLILIFYFNLTKISFPRLSFILCVIFKPDVFSILYIKSSI